MSTCEEHYPDNQGRCHNCGACLCGHETLAADLKWRLTVVSGLISAAALAIRDDSRRTLDLAVLVANGDDELHLREAELHLREAVRVFGAQTAGAETTSDDD